MMSKLLYQPRLLFIGLLLISYQTIAAYKGSHAYNHTKALTVQVNTATGSLSVNYPLIKAQGVRMPLKVSLTYSFNAKGRFGLPTGWQLDLDHITQHTAEIGGMQWLIDDLWHDETGFASGLKYYNQHGTRFRDKGQASPIPGYPYLNYRHVSHHKDGSRQFFSQQGLLTLQIDRFGNHVHFNYEEPVASLESAKLISIKDDYGNVYRFSYEPGIMIINSPDDRVYRVYFNERGVTSIENPLRQSYKITYFYQYGRNLVRTLYSPEGLLTELSYGSIFYTDDSGKKQMPVVNRFKQYDQSDLKTHHEAYYKFSDGSNYTGYPMYSLSSKGDSLIDSNDQSYKYSVEVTRVNGEQQHQQVYEYNYLHLPVEVRTLHQGQPYLKTIYKYAISPFKYSRSTNYDKPTEVTRYVWNGAIYVPSDKTTTTYDHYGNKLSKTHSVYDRQRQQWKALDATVSRYFTDHYSLLAEQTRFDLLGGRAIRKTYVLTADGKTHRHERLAWKQPLKDWQDWQQTDLTHDDKGRQRSATRRWLLPNQPGIQSVSHQIRYQFDPATAKLTITKVSEQGREHTEVNDTRNARHLQSITPKGEITTYTYDALNRPLTQTDPAGYVTRHTYETFVTDGKNTVITQSPLGDTQRKIHDASMRSISQQDLHKGQWRTISSQSFDAFGKVVSKTNILGLTTTFGYDEQGRRISNTDPWGNKHSIHYNDADATTTTLINGRQHLVVSKVPWERKQISRQYPVTNNPYEQASEFLETTVIHDAHAKVISMTSARVELQTHKKREMVTNLMRYDANHNLIASDTHTWDGLHGNKSQEYDLLNNLYTWRKTLTTPDHTSTHNGYRYIYDSDGLLTQVESPKTADHSRFYMKHRYDKNGQEIEKTLQDGHGINYQYDNRGLMIEQSWNRNQKRHTISREYDADGRLVKLSDSDGQSMHYRYTSNGRLLEMRYPDDRSISYTLDNYDRIITQKDANQTEQHFIYNPEDKGRLSSLKLNGSRIDFHYGEDDNGRHGTLLKRITNAEATGVTQTHFRYGVLGKMVESTSANPKMQYNVSYNFKPWGELIKQVQKLAKRGQPPKQHTAEYRYDGMNRLTDEVHTNNQGEKSQKRYRYDGNNNLLTEEDYTNCGPGQSLHYAYNNLDQLVNIKVGEVVKPVLHDANGRLTQDHKATQYEYDDAGFLLQVQPPQRPAIRYDYWPNGLLSHRSSNNSHSHFYPDHHKSMQTVVKDGQWRSLVRHGKGIVGRQTEQGLDQFFQANASTGVVLQQGKGETQLRLHRYDAYGKPLQHNPVNDTDFTWNQELTEPETGLTYLRHRFHHPELRRFITRDHVHVDNRYAYAHGDPVNYIDPTGHYAMNKYLGGVSLIFAGILAIIFAVPSMGASFGAASGYMSAASAIEAGTAVATVEAGSISELQAAAISGIAAPTVYSSLSVLSGASLIGSQATLDAGNKAMADNLSVVSLLAGSIAGVTFAVSAPLFPQMFESFKQLITALKAGEKVSDAFSKLIQEASATAFNKLATQELANGANEMETGEAQSVYKAFTLTNPKTEDEVNNLSRTIQSAFKRVNPEQKNCIRQICSYIVNDQRDFDIAAQRAFDLYDLRGNFPRHFDRLEFPESLQGHHAPAQNILDKMSEHLISRSQANQYNPPE